MSLITTNPLSNPVKQNLTSVLFTRTHTSYVKAFAILYMLGLHIPRTQPEPLLEALQICVPLFLFMSGFGLYKVFEKNRSFTYSKSFQRTLNLYKRYWIILSIFIPVQFIFHDRVFNWHEFFLNVPALISSYCGPAWFLSLYVELLLLFPLIVRINVKAKTYLLMILGCLLISRLVLQLKFFDVVISRPQVHLLLIVHLKMILIDLPVYMLGIAFAKYDIFSKIIKKMLTFRLDNIFVALLCIAIPIFGRAYLPMIGVTEIVFVPIEIIGIVNLCKRLSEQFGNLLHQYAVKHSTNMWFLHVFLIPYCLYIGKNKFIAYILLVLFSLLCSMVINYIIQKIKFIYLKTS